jgi:branched-chain amino acid transport system ATP-binding protein
MSDLALDQPLHPLLELVGVAVHRPGLPPLEPLTCAFDAARTTLVVGIEGSGRATLCDLLAGRLLPDRGVMRLDGQRIDRLTAAARVRLGIVTCGPERLVQHGSVRAMMLTARLAVTRPVWSLAFGLGRPSRQDREDIEELLGFVGLDHLAARGVPTLGGLEARLADLARCLAMRPRVLVVGHGLAGLEAPDRKAFAALLQRVAAAGPAIVAIDDDLATLGAYADLCLVLHRGRLLANATPRAIGEDSRVFEALTGAEL